MESIQLLCTLLLLGTTVFQQCQALEGLNFGANVHCAVRKEISPCTCKHQEQGPRGKKAISVICERMTSFSQVVTALQGRFEKEVDIRLKISHSSLDDLPQMKFNQMGLHITQLRLIHDNLSALPESVFYELSDAELLSFSDNSIETIPQNVLNLMPKVKTLDISRTNVANVTTLDLQKIQNLSTLILSSNNISLLEVNAFPPTVNKLHIGGNRIRSLNGTLRLLRDLEWLFINNNEIESLEGELPQVLPNRRLTMIIAMHNRLTSLPGDLRQFLALNHVSLSGNKIKRLDRTLANAARMNYLDLYNNQLEMLESGEFETLENLGELILDHNRIRELNGSLLPLKSLRELKISNNLLTEFNPKQLSGLTKLTTVDLSFNLIKEISSKIIENGVESEPARIPELRLEYNRLTNLGGGDLGGSIRGLRRLNVSHNLIETLSPQDLEGFSSLQKLDISHNRLTTIGEAYQTLIPSLEEIIASYNELKILEKELYGFPQICWADFSHNKLEDISSLVLERTQCKVYGVNGTLRVYIQGNHELCNAEISSKVIEVELKHKMVEFQGFDECPRQQG